MTNTIELSRFNELENVIDVGLKIFVEVGNALLEIRDSRLYREGWGTFDEYYQGRWGFTDRRARLLMSAARTVTNLETGTVVPDMLLLISSCAPNGMLESYWQRWKREGGINTNLLEATMTSSILNMQRLLLTPT